MPAASAQLSSLSSTLEEFTQRLVALADSLAGNEDTEASSLALFEAERGLRTAARAMDRAARSLPA